jgi:hypothetical protein
MPLSERRQIENEMIFRRANEVVGDKLDEIDAHHREDGNPGLVRNEDILLQFRCECSDENFDCVCLRSHNRSPKALKTKAALSHN